MSELNAVSSHARNRDLHIKVEGWFEQSAANKVDALIRAHEAEGGRVFVDVRGLRPLEPEARNLFRQSLRTVPAQRLYFKGEEGFSIGVDGSRVLIIKKSPCRCAGRCTTCACAARARERGQRDASLIEERRGPSAH